MTHTRFNDIKPYITRDGSEIRELMHPDLHGEGGQSLAHASVAAGASTLLHAHGRSEEIYYFVSGRGVMTLNGESFPVEPGDTVRIRPGVAHRVSNQGDVVMQILCCCAPPYRHEDTELLD